MPLLTSAQYPSIRAAIDVSLDAAALPDTTIALDIYAGAGEAMVVARDPNAESQSGSALTHAIRAAVYFTASLLVPAVPMITTEEEADRDYSYQRKYVDPAVRAKELMGLAELELAAYLSPNNAANAPNPPLLFAVRGGRRGR